MRPSPTRAELSSVAALIAAVEADGHSVRRVERTSQDKPDALLEIAGFRVACECIQIPPAYIYKQLHRRHLPEEWEGRDLLCISWPNEPHQWVAEAVARKTALVPDYLKRTGAFEAWLLIHTPTEVTQFFVNAEHEWLPWALRHGAKMQEHSFAQIHLWTPKSGIRPISYRKDEVNLVSELGIEFSSGYPTLNMDRGSIPFTTRSSLLQPPEVRTVIHRTKSYKTVRPRDPAYAKHEPARREAVYRFTLTTWSTRAEIRTLIEYPQEGEQVALDPTTIEGLQPASQYFHHYLYEYHAPRQLNTLHQLLPRT